MFAEGSDEGELVDELGRFVLDLFALPQERSLKGFKRVLERGEVFSALGEKIVSEAEREGGRGQDAPFGRGDRRGEGVFQLDDLGV